MAPTLGPTLNMMPVPAILGCTLHVVQVREQPGWAPRVAWVWGPVHRACLVHSACSLWVYSETQRQHWGTDGRTPCQLGITNLPEHDLLEMPTNATS